MGDLVDNNCGLWRSLLLERKRKSSMMDNASPLQYFLPSDLTTYLFSESKDWSVSFNLHSYTCTSRPRRGTEDNRSDIIPRVVGGNTCSALRGYNRNGKRVDNLATNIDVYIDGDELSSTWLKAKNYPSSHGINRSTSERSERVARHVRKSNEFSSIWRSIRICSVPRRAATDRSCRTPSSLYEISEVMWTNVELYGTHAMTKSQLCPSILVLWPWSLGRV